jgi:acyl-CoA-dependent ceramide synthase
VRSDNDEVEFAEEQRLDALAKKEINSTARPTLFLNEKSFNGKNSSTQIRTDGIKTRKALK